MLLLLFYYKSITEHIIYLIHIVCWEAKSLDKKINTGYLQKIDEYLERSPFKGFLHEVDSFFNKHHTFPINLYETDNEIIIEAELPGIEKEQIKIDIQETLIKVIIQSKDEIKHSTHTQIHHKERSLIHNEREIKLPEPIKKNDTKAYFKNGILEIRAKKSPYEQRIIGIE